MHDKYKASLDWLFFQFPAFQTQGASAYKPGLETTFQLLEAVGNPQEKLKFIHVAGTNGKGSTCSYIASLLTEKGFKTGLFTSPHIFDFRERIRINGEKIKETDVIDFCDWVKILPLTTAPSFFEITFVMAMVHFAKEKCDYVVLETGLGGRLDATNTVLPVLSIITRIGIDHQQFLGETLPEIAVEKAGIIKKNVPILIGQRQTEIENVFSEKANTEQAPLYFAEDEKTTLQIPPHLPYYHQANLKTALVAMQLLDIEITEETLNKALENLHRNTGLFGRLQRIQEKPTIWLDASHNEDGIKATLHALPKIEGQLYILYGASNDKNCEEIFQLFPKDALLNLCTFSNPRSKKKVELEALQKENQQIEAVFEDVNKAIVFIRKQMNENDALWVTGSFFLLSDIVL